MRKKHGDYFCISVAGYPEGHPNRIKKVEDGQVILISKECTYAPTAARTSSSL